MRIRCKQLPTTAMLLARSRRGRLCCSLLAVPHANMHASPPWQLHYMKSLLRNASVLMQAEGWTPFGAAAPFSSPERSEGRRLLGAVWGP